MTIQCHNLFFVIVCFVSTDADVCIDRRGCLHRPTRMSAPTDADVCIDRRGCLHRSTRTTYMLLLLQYTKLFAYLDESSDCLVELLACVTSRELHADASLALRHNRVVEARNVDAFLKQAVGVAL